MATTQAAISASDAIAYESHRSRAAGRGWDGRGAIVRSPLWSRAYPTPVAAAFSSSAPERTCRRGAAAPDTYGPPRYDPMVDRARRGENSGEPLSSTRSKPSPRSSAPRPLRRVGESSLWVLVIGLLNYLWLWRRRRLYLLVITIPVVAFATSLALFGYSAVAHGFGTRSRVRSLTLLDQKANSAVTMSRLSLYSGLAPSGGLTFSPETAVYPIWPPDTSFDSGVLASAPPVASRGRGERSRSIRHTKRRGG